MKLLESLHYQLIDNRKKLIFVLAVLISLLIIVVQAYLVNNDSKVTVLVVNEKIMQGELINESKIDRISIDQSLAKEYGYINDIKDLVAIRELIPGELLLSELTTNKDQFIKKDKEMRLVTIKLDIDKADSWIGQKGDQVEVAHFNDEEFNSLKIFEEVVVYDLIYMKAGDDYPKYAVLLVTEEQRNYIISNRGNGHFEISL
ncbi:MAG: hypothetical protein KAH05_05195 [Clostridiales bacterium]|nr:hypothetical protein [Clostridiales bacterium]